MTFWSGETLKEEVKNCILSEYDTNDIDCAAYTLHVGSEVFITPDHYETNPSQNNKKQLEHRETFTIPSGQFAFLLTEEIIQVSNKSLAFISIKATMKFKGLINVSGFHVDPGYKGRLIFSVFNAGPIPIKLQRGMPLFLMWYADLDKETNQLKNNKPVTEIDLKIIDPIHGPIFSPQEISKSVTEFKEDIRKEIHTIDKKVSNLRLIAGIVLALIIGAASYKIKHLMDEVDKLTKKNIILNGEKLTSDKKKHNTSNSTRPIDKNKPE